MASAGTFGELQNPPYVKLPKIKNGLLKYFETF